MRNRCILIFPVLLIVLTASASAEKMHGRSGDGKWGKGRYSFCSKLDLTPEQEEKIEQHRHRSRKEGMELKNELKLKYHDLKYELSRKDLDEKKIDTLVDEISSIRRKSLEHRVDSLKEFKSILTDEQWDRCRNLKLEDHEHHKKKKR